MKEQLIKTSIAMPKSLNEAIRKAAVRNNRTLTKEILSRLIASEEERQVDEDFPELRPG